MKCMLSYFCFENTSHLENDRSKVILISDLFEAMGDGSDQPSRHSARILKRPRDQARNYANPELSGTLFLKKSFACCFV